MNKEKSFLEYSADKYHSTFKKGWDNLYEKKREYLFRELSKYHLPGNALELGCADGVMTEKLLRDFSDITVVDGSKRFLEQIKLMNKSKNFELVHCSFEEYSPRKKFSNIFMTHILEHIERPIDLLEKFKGGLSKGGRIFLAVPNAKSIHRLVGVKMGMLKNINSLNEQDVILGHKRVYTPKLLKLHVRRAGLKIVKFGGCMIKPLSNRQIEKYWSNDLIQAFFDMSEDFPELCSEIFIVAE